MTSSQKNWSRARSSSIRPRSMPSSVCTGGAIYAAAPGCLASHAYPPRPVPLDLRTLATGELVADVCVVGAGAAGLALAHELRDAGADVLVLERGGERPGLGEPGENVGTSTI